jgi:hypothetical protein
MSMDLQDIVKVPYATMSTLTHPEWNQETGGLEVAKAFADQIRGKSGKKPGIVTLTTHGVDRTTVLITGVSPESIGSSIAPSPN